MSPFSPSPSGPGRAYHIYLPGPLAREVERLAAEHQLTELGIIRMLIEAGLKRREEK
jgi:hypothetical protein